MSLAPGNLNMSLMDIQQMFGGVNDFPWPDKFDLSDKAP